MSASRFKTRAELDREPRPMQFEVRNPCPDIPVNNGADLSRLPITIWVDVSAETKVFACGGRGWPILDASKARRKLKARPARRGSVQLICEHSGGLIE